MNGKGQLENRTVYEMTLRNKGKRILRFHKQLRGKERRGLEKNAGERRERTAKQDGGKTVTQRKELAIRSSLWPARLLIKQD